MVTKAQIEALKQELQEVRRKSLEASRQGDYRKVATLTLVASRINQSVLDAEARLEAVLIGANERDARRR